MVASEIAQGNANATPIRNLGPHGVGDPNDKTLRKVEIEVLIPKKMREKAKTEKCRSEVEDFHKCCMENGVSLVLYCRSANNAMKSCLGRWFYDADFKKQCQDEYLEERTKYRLTGIRSRETIKRM